jgi:hypothetical protein
MPIRSHVDPCLFVVFMHIHGAAATRSIESVVGALNARHGDSFSPILAELHPRTRQLMFHETYHFWQGLRLPFLFRYALLSYRLAIQAFAVLSKLDESYLDWSCQLPQFTRLSLPSQLGLSANGKLLFGAAVAHTSPKPDQIIQLTPLVLLETAATLAEYNVTATGNRSDPEIFRRWRKRNPGYTDVYDALVVFFGNDKVPLRCLLPMINACFHTSIPERAFAHLLGRTWGVFTRGGDFATQFLAQREPCRWTELYEMWIDELDFDAEPEVAELLDNSFYRLSLDSWVSGGFGGSKGLTHPFLGPCAREWQQRASSDASFAAVMDFPGNVTDKTFSVCMNEFQPPVSVYRFHFTSGQDRVIIHGDTQPKSFLGNKGLAPAEYRGFIADTLAMYSAVRTASGVHFDADQRTCHHTACPMYKRNPCNAYPLVPEVFAQCGFQARVGRLINVWRSS